MLMFLIEHQNESAVGMAERFGYTKYLLDNVGYDTATLGNTAENTLSNTYIKKATTDAQKSSLNQTINFFTDGADQQGSTPLSPLKATTGEEEKTKDVVLPSATDNVDFILSLWGRSDTATSAVRNESGILSKSEQIFTIPKELTKYMGFTDNQGNESGVISQTLQQVSGVLSGDDTYTNKDMSCGIINFNTILGEHSIWQILTNNCNNLMNELIPEMRFDNGIPKLTLYNRIKPFAINSDEDITRDGRAVGDGLGSKSGDTVKDNLSMYKHVRRKTIDPDDVIMSSYGTNWRDRVNFIEVTIARTLFQENYAADIKLDSQFVDQSSIGRDGLLSMVASTTYVPAKKGGVANPIGVSAYKHLLKEWHFNTHKMFNGTIQLVGQDQYIQVGDNIMVESKVINRENFNNNIKQKTIKDKTYLMAHVESITHNTAVDNNGSRVFTTSINFVRGIITDINGNLIENQDIPGAVDQDTSGITPSQSKIKQTTSTSGRLDPDRQKLKGS